MLKTVQYTKIYGLSLLLCVFFHPPVPLAVKFFILLPELLPEYIPPLLWNIQAQVLLGQVFLINSGQCCPLSIMPDMKIAGLLSKHDYRWDVCFCRGESDQKKRYHDATARLFNYEYLDSESNRIYQSNKILITVDMWKNDKRLRRKPMQCCSITVWRNSILNTLPRRSPIDWKVDDEDREKRTHLKGVKYDLQQ